MRRRRKASGRAPSGGWARYFLRADAGAHGVRRDIEGMRAVAVLLVLVFHAGVDLPGGFVGVDVFFVISGFIITGMLFKELESTWTISIIGFYGRRAKRLLPATAAVLVGTLLMTFALIPRVRWSSIADDFYASVFYSMNWRLYQLSTDYAAQGQAQSPLQHFWSLGVEEQFYLIWPGLILLATLYPLRWGPSEALLKQGWYTRWVMGAMALITVPSFLYCLWFTAHHPDPAYFSTFTRLWELSVGGGLAVAAHWLLRTPKPLALVLSWVGVAMIVASAFLLTEADFPGRKAVLPVVGAALVIGFCPAAGRPSPQALLGVRPMVWIGGLSYSLYLWHWPLLVVARARWEALSWQQGLVVVAASGVLAWASKRYIEDPVRRAPTLSVSPAKALQVGATCMGVGVAGALVIQGVLWPPPPPVHQATVALIEPTKESVGGGPMGAEVLDPKHPKGDPAGAPTDRAGSISPDPQNSLDDIFAERCIDRADGTDVHPCPYGATSSSTNVAVLGDSHAGQWMGALDAIARDRGWRLTGYLKQNCLFAEDLTIQYETQPYSNCTGWVSHVMAALADSPPDMVIISGQDVLGYHYESGREVSNIHSPAVHDAYAKTFRDLQAMGSKVVVIEDTPRPGLVGDLDEHECVAEHRTSLTKCAFSRAVGLPGEGELKETAESAKGVTAVDLNDAICPTKECAAVIGDVMVYRDTNHLTATYVATLGPRLNKAIPQL